MKNKNLPQLDKEESLMEFLRAPTDKIAAGLTEILASDQKDWKLSVGKLIQTTIKAKRFTQLGEDIKKLRETDEILEDFLATDKKQSTLKELLKFIDEDAPEEELFKAMKSIFFTSIKKGAAQEEEFLAYEFLQTAKRLSGTEVLILKANFTVVRRGGYEFNKETSFQNWSGNIAGEMGFANFPSLVAKYDDNLTSLKLLTHRIYQDSSGVRLGNHYRLTDTGYKFCEYIMNYP